MRERVAACPASQRVAACLALLLFTLLATAWSGTARPRYDEELRIWRRLLAPSSSQKFDGGAPGALRLRRQVLRVALDPTKPRFEVTGTLTFDVVASTSGVWFFAPSPALQSVRDENGRELSFSLEGSGSYLRVEFPEPPAVSSVVTLQLRLSGTPSCASDVVSASCAFTPSFFWVLGLDFGLQPVEGPRHFELELTLVTPAGFTIASALEKVNETLLDDGRREALYRSYSPTASYGFSGASFSTVERVGSNGTRISVLTSGARAPYGELLASWTDETLSLLEAWLGPYPYPTLVVSEFSEPFGGAFAPQAAAFLSQRVLDRIATDPLFVREVLAHELSHQWFGHLIAAYDYRDILLQEGMSEWLAGHVMRTIEGSERLFRRNRLEYLYGPSGGDESALAPFQPIGSLRLVAYSKASVVLDSLRYEVGEGTFLAGLRRLVETKRFDYASVDDFRLSLESELGDSLETFFSQWIARPGVPRLRLRLTRYPFDLGAPTDDWSAASRLTLEQLDELYDLALPLDVTDRQGRRLRVSIPAHSLSTQQHLPFAVSHVAWQQSPYPLRVERNGGDLNHDGFVDGRDLLALAARWGDRVSLVDSDSGYRLYDESWNLGSDLVHDGVIDALDRNLVENAFGSRL